MSDKKGMTKLNRDNATLTIIKPVSSFDEDPIFFKKKHMDVLGLDDEGYESQD